MNLKDFKGKYVKITLNLESSLDSFENVKFTGKIHKVSRDHILLSDPECLTDNGSYEFYESLCGEYLKTMKNKRLYIAKIIILDCKPVDGEKHECSDPESPSMADSDDRIYRKSDNKDRTITGLQIILEILNKYTSDCDAKESLALVRLYEDKADLYDKEMLEKSLQNCNFSAYGLIESLSNTDMFSKSEKRDILYAVPFLSPYALNSLMEILEEYENAPDLFEDPELVDSKKPCQRTIIDNISGENSLFRPGRKIKEWSSLIKIKKKEYKPRYPGTVMLKGGKVDNEIYDLRYNNPMTIYQELKKRVSTHREALKKIACSAHRHYIKRSDIFKLSRIKPEVFLLAGPTGCGKTYIMQNLADMLGLPFVHADASSLVQAGIIGNTLYNCLDMLRDSAVYVEEEAEQGIFFLDEIDKLFIRDDRKIASNYYGESVQNELLRIMEGSKVHIEKSEDLFDTSRLFFVLGGAFEGIEEIIAKRLRIDKKLGFRSKEDTKGDFNEKKLYSYITKEDIINYGFQRQLLARVNAFAGLAPLGIRDYMNILKNRTSSPFITHIEYLKACGINLVIENDEIYSIIAEYASTRPFGARILSDIIDYLVNELSFDLIGIHSADIILTKKYVSDKIMEYEGKWQPSAIRPPNTEEDKR